MSNTSATGGYLAATSGPLTNVQIEDALHDLVAGITGLAGDLVRPRWQETPPKQPARDVNWCSIGVADRNSAGAPAVQHSDVNGGMDTVTTWESLDVVASFYGPDAAELAGILRDGLSVEQNRAALRAAGLALGGVGVLRSVPELVNNAWIKRVDLDLEIRNETRRTYAVLNILCGPATIESDTGLIVQTTPMEEN